MNLYGLLLQVTTIFTSPNLNQQDNQGGALCPVFNMTDSSPNWRDDSGLACITKYKRKFALWPIVCADGSRVWFTRYYTKYEIWGVSSNIFKSDYLHVDFVEYITEAEYIVRRLTEGV